LLRAFRLRITHYLSIGLCQHAIIFAKLLKQYNPSLAGFIVSYPKMVQTQTGASASEDAVNGLRERPFILDFTTSSLRTVNKYSLRNVALLIGVSVVVAFVAYGVSLWLLGSLFPSSELSGMEGILFILAGVCSLLGSGGISRNTAKAAMLASAASAMGSKTIGPSEIMRRDAWKPKGHTRLGLTLIIAGVALLVFSFVLIWMSL